MTTKKPKAITINYKNAKLYTLRSPHTEKIYIGATTQTLSQRMTLHRNHFKRWTNRKQSYITSFEILHAGDAYIELLRECPCDNKEQLAKYEGEAIRDTPNCCNKVIPDRTQKEYYEANKDKLKEYREANKDKMKEYHKANKEAINQRYKEFYEVNKDRINQRRGN